MLSDEQATMVSGLVSSGDGVQIVRAKAGTGKTTAIDAARELWERDGHRVVGAALAARAADELRSRGGIESSTIHGLLSDLDRGGDYGFPSGRCSSWMRPGWSAPACIGGCSPRRPGQRQGRARRRRAPAAIDRSRRRL
ncbi:MAG: AAA family ATPase [Thermoleophilaceae bacterium]